MAPQAKPAASGLVIRKLADRSGKRLSWINATTGETEFEPWPLHSVVIEGEPPMYPAPSVTVIDQGRDEGWVTVEGERVVHCPGGPPGNPWRDTWTFRQYDVVVICGVRYRVLCNPGKYRPDGVLVLDAGEDYAAIQADSRTVVNTFYSLELEG